MDLTIYDVIKGPWVTAKAYELNSRLKQLVLEVHPHSNKVMIIEALRKLFNVDAEHVRIIVVKPRMRRVGRRAVFGKTRKKAMVILKDGQALNIAGLTPVEHVQHDEHVAS